MKLIRNILSGIWKVYFGVFFALSLLLMYPFFYWSLSKKETFPITFKLKRFWALMLQVFGGVLLSIKLKKDLPKDQPYIICPNHSSYFDIILLYRVFSKYFIFMGKQELASWPLFKIFFTKGMNITVDRASKIGSHRALLKVSSELDKGNPVVMFPEGTIPPTAPRLKPFKNGAFKLAIEKQIPIVPVTFTNNWRRLQGSKLFKGMAGPGFTKAIVHEPIDTKGMTEADIITLRNKVFETIKEPLQKYYN